MKTLLFIVVSVTMLLSGCKSKEEKVNKLITLKKESSFFTITNNSK